MAGGTEREPGHRLDEREDSNLYPSAPPSASSQQHPNLERNLPGGVGVGSASPNPSPNLSPTPTSPPNPTLAAPRPSASALFRLFPDPKPVLSHHRNPIPNFILTPALALGHHSSNYKPCLVFTSGSPRSGTGRGKGWAGSPPKLESPVAGGASTVGHTGSTPPAPMGAHLRVWGGSSL